MTERHYPKSGLLQPQLQSRLLFTVRIFVEPAVVVGKGGNGVRRVAVVSGGVFEGGAGLRGSVHPGGNDWLILRQDGSMHLDARILLETEGGRLIAMSYTGIRNGSKPVLEKLSAGEYVDPSEYYFRTTCRFETEATEFAFLERIVAVGIGERLPDGVRYDIFEVL